jgi:hypothetical protein
LKIAQLKIAQLKIAQCPSLAMFVWRRISRHARGVDPLHSLNVTEVTVAIKRDPASSLSSRKRVGIDV